ncbi:hypothetical protein [Clostridium oceanicum]|uniref:Uncharacterized protein n=1 Tax=Clostridium oceanicum TaxID=1543 RepID=A0ABN1JKC9_9CLOT
MKSKKILATLVLTALFSSSGIGMTQTVFAQSGTGSVLSQGIGQARIPNLQSAMGSNGYYYENGFPSRIDVETKQFNSNNVVLDYISLEGRDFSNVTVGNDDVYSFFTGLNVKGYITVEDKVVNTYVEALEAAKRKGVIGRGEKIMSIILQKDSPLIDDIKVERHTYFQLIGSRVLTPGDSSVIKTSTTYGITNQEAYSIAKTVGMEFTAGLGFSKGPLSANVGMKLSSSLTETFSNTYSVNKSTTEEYTHNFGISDVTRRAALYQYVESYKARPIMDKERYSRGSTKYFMDRLIPAKDTNYKTNRIQNVAVRAGTPSTGAPSVISINTDTETDTGSTTTTERDLTTIGYVNPKIPLTGRRVSYMTNTRIAGIRQLSGNPVKYDSQKGGFIVDGTSKFVISIDVQRNGVYDLGIDFKSLGVARNASLSNQNLKISGTGNDMDTSFVEGPIRLNSGRRDVEITLTGKGILKEIRLERNSYDAVFVNHEV